jgi:hypothetical protein
LTYTFDYTFRARISEQSELDVSGSFDIDAYDEIDVAVPADNTTVPVRIRGASTAQVVIITSSDYHQLEYHAGDRTRAIQLDRPHILTSAGLLARLGLTSGRLYFRKGGGDDAAVRIFVGTGDDRERYAHELGTTEIEPQRAEGGRYPAAEFDLEARLNEAEEDRDCARQP